MQTWLTYYLRISFKRVRNRLLTQVKKTGPKTLVQVTLRVLIGWCLSLRTTPLGFERDAVEIQCVGWLRQVEGLQVRVTQDSTMNKNPLQNEDEDVDKN